MPLRIADDVVAQNVQDELVLLKFGSGIYYGLDAVGRRIFERLAEHGDRTRAVDELIEEYDVARDRLAKDVDDLVRSLVAAGILVDAKD